MSLTRSLISSRPSDSGLHIQLHPLVLLTISDQITRHAARQQQGLLIGALLGQHNGQEISIEHVFECPITMGEHGAAILPSSWFEERLKQFKDVHKDPALELVGWWSTTSSSGPDHSLLPIHRQILQNYNDSAIFLAFHPSEIQSNTHSTKLPLTVYETVLEGDNVPDAAKDMQVDGEEFGPNIRFRELPYSVETEEAEMIGVDTIAQTAGTASRSEMLSDVGNSSASNNVPTDETKSSHAELTQEEEELVASLQTRLNAVRTLESRISLIKSYISSVSVVDSTTKAGPDSNSPKLSHPLLRNINSLISHLSILSPSDQSSFSAEILSQSNDVKLVSLLGELGESVRAMRELGRKSATVQTGRQLGNSRKQPNDAASRSFEDEFLARGPRQGGERGTMYT
ncbi:COP9 signalosome complex subunit 6 [Penicillium ucsense]|uniref:COP9 signalosome complex subunit 6 n=1 Tax=Penicillium ucsense TaxID=2839758 RepID=A0A8J8W4J3_9EURO|nr:COP9 signalosome complex subunit 6 [Penicillium ucsense]KAF7737445.1 COP9 signalosome complex subunit 6 [Penicillium ucsense]